MRKIILSLLVWFSLVAEPMSLAELIDRGLQNNPETTKAWANTKRAQAQLGLAQSEYYPTVGIQGKLTHGRDVKFVNGPEVIFTNYGADLVLSYLLFDFGERKAEVQAMRSALKASRWSEDFLMQKIIYKISASYYEYLSAQELIRTKETTLKDVEQIQDAAQELLHAVLRSETDQALSKAAVAQLQIELAEWRAKAAVAYCKLLMELGLPFETKIEIDTALKESEVILEGVHDLIAKAEEKRADVLAMKATLSELHERVKKSRRSQRPKLRALGQGGWIEYVKHKDRGYNYTAGLAIDIPLLKVFENTYKNRKALAYEEITAFELKQLQEEVALEVITYSAAVKASQEALPWSGRYLEEAIKSYEAALENYKAGLHNIFNLLQTQQSLADARMKETEAKTKWRVALAQLAFATGSIQK